jgi:WD40 repeat protein
MTNSIMRIHHPTSVRSLVFSPSTWLPLQALAGLDNGSIFRYASKAPSLLILTAVFSRWDLRVGQRGQLDRLHVAHTGPVTSLDWCPVGGISTFNATSTSAREDSSSSGLGWIVSGGLDRTVKVGVHLCFLRQLTK